MKLINRSFYLTLIIILTFSCKKTEPERHCWMIIDNLGNPVTRICDKTESELLECVNNRSCISYTSGTLSTCNYYVDEGEKFCWMINNAFVKGQAEAGVTLISRCFGAGGIPQKVACNYCSKWYSRTKHLYKPANTFFYSVTNIQQYCGDTAKTLFQGRQVIKKDNPDSLVTLQFSSDGINW